MARGEIYAQVSCDYYDNAKMIEAGEKAELLYLRALCLSNRLLLDGRISEAHLTALRFPDGHKRAEALVRVGLWERVPGGWVIVGWHERNRSRMEVMEIRQAEAERKRKARAERRASRGAKGQPPDTDDASGECPPGRPPDTDRTSAGQVPAVRSMSGPQRSTHIDQRSTLNAHRSATDEVNSVGTSQVLPRQGSAPDLSRRNGETHAIGASAAAVMQALGRPRP